jgi:hypothetical protein
MARHASKQAAELIRMEYAEFPGLRLTFWQAQRLWSLQEDVCREALAALTRSQFLLRTADGAYVRAVSSSGHRENSGCRPTVLSQAR